MKVKLSILLFLFSTLIYCQNVSVREDFVGNLTKQIETQCSYSGDIIIEISENNSSGKVIAAKYVEGNVKADKCAIDESLNHAKSLLFKTNRGAPEIQTTKILYKIRPIKKTR